MNKQQANLIHINQLEGLKPESVALVHYVAQGIPFTMLEGHSISYPFLKCSINFGMWFNTTHEGKEIIREFLFVYKNGEACALIERIFVDGALDTDYTGFYQFVVRAYDQGVVIAAANDLPCLIGESVRNEYLM
ncbi:hypothetical protein [Photobacterium leiognathi]|uniref:hypothetical protein n=1 Tax=Photobacterium leiognathi TaxID=553611 RepID=UPI00298116C0|nr:hypothetical protein [Photobacterium leiognathi]